MPDFDDSDSTLPSLQAALPGLQTRPELVLSIIFHPQTDRAGEFAVLDRRRRSRVLGRGSVEFRRGPTQDGAPLQERHVSRRALEIEFKGDGLVLRRPAGSCRCRVGGTELDHERHLNQQALVRGVPLLLAHSVVLWLAYTQEPMQEDGVPDFGLVGGSRYMQGLRNQLLQAARSDLDVLLLGATGTGKEVVANAIHAAGQRAARPLVAVNVAAIPESLAPAALFGAARGAFTGADRARRGYFQQAAGGTLFLDEIGDAPAQIQPQLLRALQQREIQGVGAAVEKIDLRVISATDADIDGSGSGFKSALRHRLGAVEIVLKPLQQHREDIGELLNHFFALAFSREGRADLLPCSASSARSVAGWAGLYHACLCYHWPGNVRQLINFCNQIAVASRAGLVIPPSVLLALAPAGQRDPEAATEPAQVAKKVCEPASVAQRLRRILDVTEEEFARAMRDNCHEVKTVALSLGVSRQAVYRKIASSERYRLASEIPESELEQAVLNCKGDTLAAARLLEVSPSGLQARLRQEQSRL
jgi:DNA-binding NtrC family response regulator